MGVELSSAKKEEQIPEQEWKKGTLPFIQGKAG
jgi:hypothetical protein